MYAMVRHYRRLPALLVLVVATAAGAVYVKVSGKANGTGTAKLEELAKTIGDKDDAKTWETYGELLSKASPPRFDQAALAYGKVLEKEPDNRNAKVHRAMALAQVAGDAGANEFYNYMRSIVYSEPKLAMELLERQECKPHLSQARFVALAKEARAQAMD
jgi:tetratricopeptide (TPR) repeat protein